jgi:hypothetical protein
MPPYWQPGWLHLHLRSPQTANLSVASGVYLDILTLMNQGRCMLGQRLLGWVLVFGSLAMPARADSLTWRKDKNAVDADISTWSLVHVLETIAESTGWQIYLEPGTQRRVSTKFKDRTPDRALDLLLGNLGRALLPGTNGGPSRLLVFRNTEKDATQRIRATRRGKPIPNELIVRLKTGANADELARKLGGKVVGRSKGLNAARLQFENEEAAAAARDALQKEESVTGIDPNFSVVDQPLPQGADSAAMPNLKLQPLKEGEGIIIGLIDTAIQKQGGALDGFLLPGISVAGDADPPADQPTHGTSMWETLLKGIAAGDETAAGSKVRILPVDIYGNNGTTTTFEVAEGLYQALQKGAGIVNLSLGSDGDPPLLRELIRQATDSGRVIIASAGNEPVTTPVYPAAYPGVIAVTAGDQAGNIAPYANRGDFVDVVAPGTAVIPFNGQPWRVSGTSPAAAYVTGLIAGSADAAGKTPAQTASTVLKALPVPQAPAR